MLLQISLAAAVPLHILDLQARGGPGDQDWLEATAFGQVLAEKGDVLQFGGKPGEAASLFNRLARAVAVMSFCPGGVKVFGAHYESEPPADAAPTGGSDLEDFLRRLREMK